MTDEPLKFVNLSIEDKLKLIEAYVRGRPVEYFCAGGWYPKGDFWGKLDFRSDIPYRIARTKPSVNWDHVHPNYNYIARDESGESYAYGEKPKKTHFGWRFTLGAGPENTAILASYDPGGCDWKDSLISRPGQEEKE